LLFIIAAVALIGIGFEGRNLILGTSVQPSIPAVKPDVKGVATEIVPNIKNNVQDQLDNLKTESAKRKLSRNCFLFAPGAKK